MSLQPGTRLGPYAVVEPLGAGGMGEVYRGRDPRLRRDVAIKVLPEDFGADLDRLRRFREEALTLSQLNHPNVVHIYDLGEEGSLRFVAMELVEGQTFRSLLEAGPPPLDRLLSLCRQTLAGLTKAHGAGIVHRDLKPDNLMVTDDGFVKILDFGLARHVEPEAPGESEGAEPATLAATRTEPGMMLGTAGYMSPEQAKGQVADHRSDQFSFGVVLYEMASGCRPFDRASAAECIGALLHEEPAPLGELREGLPVALRELVGRCMAKNPDERFATTAELLAALEAVTSETPVSGAYGRVDGLTAEQVEAAGHHRTPLAGRDEELDALVAHAERLRGGHGGLVTLVGEPGVGKTRLTEEIGSRAREMGCLTLVGHCYEGEGAPPYSPWIEILQRSSQITPPERLRELLGEGGGEVARIFPELRQQLPDLPPALDLPPEQSRPYLFRCFAEFVERASQGQPLLLVLEDLHWADDATLQLLEHLAPRLGEIPLLLLATYRDVDLEVSRPLAKTLRQLVRERLIEKVALHRLGEAGVAAMLEGLAGRPAPASLARLIHDETEGNPFFVEEVFLHLEEENRLFDESGDWHQGLSAEDLEVPEGVRLVVGRRLENLSEDESAALTAAAVIGRRFSFEVLEKVSVLDADPLLDAVEHAERLKLIEPVATSSRRETGYRFGHELIRQTLLSALSMPRRQRLHLRIAEALEAAAADPTQRASTLAHHLYQAGAAADEEKTVQYLTLAGDQALETGAFEDAHHSFDDALSLLEGGAPAVRAHLLRSRGLARQSLGRWEEALVDWEKTVPLYEELADHETLAELGVAGAYLLFWQALPAQGVTLAGRVLESVPEEQAGDRIRLRGILGACQSMTRDVETGGENTALAVAAAEELGDPKILGEALRWRCWHSWFAMERGELVVSSARAADLLREVGDSWGFVDAAGQHNYASSHVGDLAGAARFGSEAEELAERLGNFGACSHFKIARLIRVWIPSADIVVAEELLQDILLLLEKAGTAWHTALSAWLSEFWFRGGEWKRARDHAASMEDNIRGTAWEGLIPSLHLRLECYLGDEAAAREVLERVVGQAPDLHPPTTVGAYELLFARIEGLSELRAHEEVAELYPMAEAALATGAVVCNLGYRCVETIAGIAAGAGGQWDLAERHFGTALRQAEEIPFATEKADARRFYAQMLMRRDEAGDRDRARTLLEDAIALYGELGQPRHRELAEAELRGLAGPGGG